MAPLMPKEVIPARLMGAEMLVILSALRVCACFTRIICSYRARQAHASSPIPRLGLNHNLGAFPTRISAPFQLLAPTAEPGNA